MHIGVAYADMHQQIWLRLEVPDGSTVQEAIELSGILERVAGIDLEQQKVGIYGKTVKLSTKLQEADRVEIYRPIIADPDTVPRRDKNDEDGDNDEDEDDD